MRRYSRATIALLLTALAGCATLRQLQFEMPTVGLETVEISNIDLSGGSLVLWLDVYNPNDYEIRTTRVDASLDLEGTHFGDATFDGSVALAAASHTMVKIPAEFEWEGVGAGARALLQRGEVGYELETKLRVETDFGGRDVTLRNRGEVPLKKLVP